MLIYHIHIVKKVRKKMDGQMLISEELTLKKPPELRTIGLSYTEEVVLVLTDFNK